MRILVHPNDIQSAQEAIQDKVSATTAICKQVKTILDKIDDMYAQSLDSEEVGISYRVFSYFNHIVTFAQVCWANAWELKFASTIIPVSFCMDCIYCYFDIESC